MAKTKGSVKEDYSRIPVRNRTAVRKLMAMYGRRAGKTPLAVFRDVRKHWKQQAQEKAAKDQAEAERQKKMAQDDKQRTLNTVEESISRLAHLRDELDAMQRASDAADRAMFAHALLVKVGSEMEEALFRLGITEGFSAGGRRHKREGWFAESLDVRGRFAN
jgi:hypothetical protein